MTVRIPQDATASALIKAANAFNVEAFLSLFTQNAVIDDPSTGRRFVGHAGIRDYVERYFVGYHTVTKILMTEAHEEGRLRMRVDFTGDFGHEIGLLDLVFDTEGRIVRIDADLE